MPAEGKGSYALLLCAEDSEYVKKVHGGYYDVFVDLLGDQGETWHVYHASRGHLPRDDGGVIDGYDGFVITGSCCDAHGDDRWIKELIDLVAILNAKRKKVLGVCFGHQILCRALGGKTGRASKGWDIGVTCIHPSHCMTKLLSSLQIPCHLPVIECHQDEVWELPPLAEVMAKSDRTGIEMFRFGDHIMGIQGHPEYSKDILLHLVDRLLQSNVIQNSHAEAANERLSAREPNREAWKKLCKGFLKGNLLPLA
ncbi:gamma-glutamyl peptidase 3-like [Typha angustifolia]|uniref:gamma-glutamyl peptidase 3-like n=1 Tax=Typha angustifolia TaxID=59011 RepID=UPI003C2B6BB8